MGNRPANSFANSYEKDAEKLHSNYQILRDLDLYVLDNSIRESTVGQLRGHTLENKWQIYQEVKKCRLKNIVVASLNNTTQVDDIFVQQLVERGEDTSGLFAFSEITNAIKNKMPDTETIPVGLQKRKEFGLYNVILELDLGNSTYDFNRFSLGKMAVLIKRRIIWTHENLRTDAKIFLNFRDLPDVMPKHSERIFYIIDYLARLPKDLRLFGILCEEPNGFCYPDEFGLWAKYIRKKMNANGWNGHLLVHVHEKFVFSDYVVIQALMNGANGIWASICREGAVMGNASTCRTLINMIRMGNKKVLQNFNFSHLRKAAISITKITTVEEPNIKEPIYGERALDLVLSLDKEEFDMAVFFGENAPVRITALSSPEIILTHLKDMFGDDKHFTLERAQGMKEVILEDLIQHRKEEYMSLVGLAMLFDRSGGTITSAMRDAIAVKNILQPHAQTLLAEVHRRWDLWDCKDEVQGDEMLQYDSFYNGFMTPYFSSYRCSDTRKALQALDIDKDGYVDWNEFSVYLKWAIHEYPDIKDADELLDIAFRKGLIPAMHDEILKSES